MTARLWFLLAGLAACRGGFARLERDATAGEGDDGVVVDGATSDGAVIDAAVVDGPSACAGDLSNIGGGDFEITFRIVTTSTGGALFWQRASCNNPTYWDVSVAPGAAQGRVLFAVRDATITATSPSGALVNDGAPHDVRITRITGNVQITVDGANPNGQFTPVTFGAMPPLTIQGAHPCGTAAAVATLSNICVRPL